MELLLLSVNKVWSRRAIMPEEVHGEYLSDMIHPNEGQVSFRLKSQMTDNKEKRKCIDHGRIPT